MRFYHCHCRRCRKATGTGHASNLLVTPLASLTWLAGEELLRRYEDETERMAAERQPPSADAVLRAGTRQQLVDAMACATRISPIDDEARAAKTVALFGMNGKVSCDSSARE